MCLGKSDPGFEAANHWEAMPSAIIALQGSGDQRNPKGGVFPGKIEGTWKDADDCTLLAINANSSAKNCRIGSELRMPEIFSQQNDIVLPCLGLSRREETASHRLHT